MALPLQMRKIHRIASITSALPIGIILVTGMLLLLKKQLEWVQPPTMQGSGDTMVIGWDQILTVAQGVPEAGIKSWEDVDRLDVRPDRNLVKVRANNRWELQIDLSTGAVLSSTYRRSDLIESLHDGSWFHDYVKTYVWVPNAVLLLTLWCTGVYLWILPRWVRARRER